MKHFQTNPRLKELHDTYKNQYSKFEGIKKLLVISAAISDSFGNIGYKKFQQCLDIEHRRDRAYQTTKWLQRIYNIPPKDMIEMYALPKKEQKTKYIELLNKYSGFSVDTLERYMEEAEGDPDEFFFIIHEREILSIFAQFVRAKENNEFLKYLKSFFPQATATDAKMLAEDLNEYIAVRNQIKRRLNPFYEPPCGYNIEKENKKKHDAFEGFICFLQKDVDEKTCIDISN